MVQLYVVMTFVISMKIDLYSSYLFASILFTFLRRILRLVSYCFLLILKSRKKVLLTLKFTAFKTLQEGRKALNANYYYELNLSMTELSEKTG